AAPGVRGCRALAARARPDAWHNPTPAQGHALPDAAAAPDVAPAAWRARHHAAQGRPGPDVATATCGASRDFPRSPRRAAPGFRSEPGSATLRSADGVGREPRRAPVAAG